MPKTKQKITPTLTNSYTLVSGKQARKYRQFESKFQNMKDATLEESYFYGVWLSSKVSVASDLPFFDRNRPRHSYKFTSHSSLLWYETALIGTFKLQPLRLQVSI